jgi:AraC-like DNA-binding protein
MEIKAELAAEHAPIASKVDALRREKVALEAGMSISKLQLLAAFGIAFCPCQLLLRNRCSNDVNYARRSKSISHHEV